MNIVPDKRQQDGIASVRWDRKSTEALWEDGGEREEGSPMYLRIVGRKENVTLLYTDTSDCTFLFYPFPSLTVVLLVNLISLTRPLYDIYLITTITTTTCIRGVQITILLHLFSFALLHADTSDCLLPSISPPSIRATVFIMIWSHVYDLILSPHALYDIYLLLWYDLAIPMYDTHIRATDMTTGSIGGAQIHIYLVNSTTDSLCRAQQYITCTSSRLRP